MTRYLESTPTRLIQQLRSWFHARDRSLVLDDDTFIELDEITKPGDPVSGRWRFYKKANGLYLLDSASQEYNLLSEIWQTDEGGIALQSDALGNITEPTNACFLAYNSATDSNVTGNSIGVVVDFDTEIYDLGGNFAADVFTAPIAGRYHFETTVKITGASAHGAFEIQLTTSNRNYQTRILTANVNNSGEVYWSLSTYADMDLNDTARVDVVVYGGTQTVSIAGGGSPLVTWFSGRLVQ